MPAQIEHKNSFVIMFLMFITVLGLVAGTLAVISSLPQILKIIKTKKTRDISLPMYVILNTATFLWIIYGVLSRQIAIIIPNTIFLVFNMTILYFKIKHG